MMGCLECFAFINRVTYQTLHPSMQCDLFSYGVPAFFKASSEGSLCGGSQEILVKAD